MPSPLEYDAKIKKEFGIDDSIEIDNVIKLAYTRAQIEELQKMLWRQRVELIMAEEQVKSSDPVVSNNALPKLMEYKFTIKQFVTSIKVLTALKDELELLVDEG